MYWFDSSIIYLIPAMLFAMYAQAKVSSAYSQYAKVRNRKGITGAQAARLLLDQNGLSDVRIEMIQGRLSDHYDPRKRVMRLSSAVYNDASIASVSIAAHETGHAIQHGLGYVPLSIRNTIAPVVSLVSNLAWPLLLIGLFMGNSPQGSLLFNLGILFFCGAVV
ncbi:MAG: zinc metallopeptidase, partial [Anaerovorax sp.]|nr:zinc metallopeptidase [Anaerovorax sp.]